MSAEKETLGRVQNGLFHLQRGLTPFVSARMKAVHGDRWLHYASRAHPRNLHDDHANAVCGCLQLLSHMPFVVTPELLRKAHRCRRRGRYGPTGDL